LGADGRDAAFVQCQQEEWEAVGAQVCVSQG